MKSWRLWVVTISIFLTYSALVFNIYNLQVQKGGYYSARAASQHNAGGFLSSQRGSIYFQDRSGNKIPAAINREYPVIYAVPKEIEDVDEAAELLGPIVGLKIDEIKAMLSKPNDLYELLSDKASSEQVNQINELNLDGVYINTEHFRFYPFEFLASQVLGYVGPNEDDGSPEGHYGLEALYNDHLANEDLILTIDRNIQAQSEKTLKDLISKYNASGGTVIVQEPSTGKILAMGNYPDFDPNSYSEYPLRNFLNSAIQAVFEPGSVFKVITMAAGMDSSKITPDTKYYDSGSLTLNGRTIKNWDLKAHGWVTMTEVIEQSINTGAAFAEQKTGHDIFYNYLLDFGFNDITGIAIPGEISGTLRNLEGDSRDINFATAAFGQGVSVTPLQLISAISTIANEGVLMKPYIVEEEKPQAIRGVMTPESADKITGMMVSAVRKAEIAQIPGYEIAGKTGTAQIPDFRYGGYSEEFIHTYVGFAPASDPKFSILIKIDKPIGAPLAGWTVVPAFRELAQFIINYYNIPADNLDEK